MLKCSCSVAVVEAFGAMGGRSMGYGEGATRGGADSTNELL